MVTKYRGVNVSQDVYNKIQLFRIEIGMTTGRIPGVGEAVAILVTEALEKRGLEDEPAATDVVFDGIAPTVSISG